MNPRRGNLRPAHSGYRYQDIASAYMLVRALVEGYDRVIADCKDVVGDKIDDLEVTVSGKRIRRQIKSSENTQSTLTYNHFSGASSSLRFDHLVSAFVRTLSPADEYRLCATWLPPTTDDALTDFLEPASADPTFIDSNPRFFRLRGDRIWPENQEPVWPVLVPFTLSSSEFDRNNVIAFCERFLIELELPIASRDLKNPGMFEHALLDLLAEKIGIGRYPNQGRSVEDVAALAVSMANWARTQQDRPLTPEDVENILEIRTDFGRVAQSFPMDESIFYDRPDFRKKLFKNALAGGVHLVTAHPGAGKSWELTRLADELKKTEVIVARHYCYLEPGDEYVERRVTTDVLFGNLLADLNEEAKKYLDKNEVGFSSGLSELESTISKIATRSERSVVLIVDGLDHIARVRSVSHTLSDDETDIVEKLATITLPKGVSLIIGSQPGKHLEPLRDQLVIIEHLMPAWQSDDVIALAKRHGVESALVGAGLTDETEISDILALLAMRADGNPLYTRCLASGFVAGIQNGSITNPHDWLSASPMIEGNIAVYYAYLYGGMSENARIVADLLGVIDFSISEKELHEAMPAVSFCVSPSIALLNPVLTTATAQGGLRIFHESFRRFILDELVRQNRELKDVLNPIIDWLKKRGFYSDSKCYRFLLPALRRSGRDDEVLSYVDSDFASNSVAHAHPPAAIQKNLALASDVAGRGQNWPALVRCAELCRAIATCFDGSQNTWDEFWTTYVDLFGAEALAERLLFDGRPTQTLGNGLLVCALIDDAGGVAPWREYLDLSEEPSESGYEDSFDKNGTMSQDQLISLATVQGRLRLGQSQRVLKRLCSYLYQCGDEFNPNFLRKLSGLITRSIGSTLIERVATLSNSKRSGRRITKRAATALLLGIADEYKAQGDGAKAAVIATQALNMADTAELAVACVELGAPATVAAVCADAPETIPIAVGPDDHFQDASGVRRWFASVRLLAALSTWNSVLTSERQRIQGDGWYRCWLRFALGVASAEAANRNGMPFDINGVFAELTNDLDPFRGEPRPCDLYAIGNVIHEVIALGLTFLKTEQDWEKALECLSMVCDGVCSRLDREDGGPLSIGTLINLIMPYKTDAIAASHVQRMIERKVEGCNADGTYYPLHADYTMRLARTQYAAGQKTNALESWRQAGVFLVGYGFHKDITLFDIIASVPALLNQSPQSAIDALCELQPLVSASLRHTDRRETKYAPNAWFKSLLKVSPIIACELLACTMLEGNGIDGWQDVQAIEDILNHVIDSADPLLVDALWETILFDIDYENQSASMAKERLTPIKLNIEKHPFLAHQRLRRLLAEAKDDGIRYNEDAVQCIKTFAEELYLPTPQVVTSPKESKNTDLHKLRQLRGENPILIGMRVPAFSPDASFTELLSGLREVGKQRGWNDPDELSDVVLSMSYRLGAMADNGNEADARRLIYFFARDAGISWSNKLHPLANVALSLANAGYSSLAAVAYVLAYTSTRGGGGWLSLGDQSHGGALKQAIKLDSKTALQTLADEIAYRLRHLNYGAGISRHLIERISEWGQTDVAALAWNEAFSVISRRLPLFSKNSSFGFTALEQTERMPWTTDESLVALLFGRVGEPRLTRKVAALSGIVRAIQHKSESVAKPLRWWLSRNAHTTSVILVFQALLKAEDRPYLITNELNDILIEYAKCDSWGISKLSSLLLERAGLPTPARHQPVGGKDDLPNISQCQIQRILNIGESEVLETLSKVWPEFPELLAKRFYALVNGVKAHKSRIRSRLRLAYGRDGSAYPPTPVLRWETEMFVAAQHEGLIGLPLQLWRNGLGSPELEYEFLEFVLPDVPLHLAWAASRTVRPEWPKPDSLTSGHGSPQTLPDDDHEFAGWSRLAIIEDQFVNNPDVRSSRPVEVIRSFAGIVATPPGQNIPSDFFPLKDGDSKDWWMPTYDRGEDLIQAMDGCIVGVSHVKDWLGNVMVLIPPSEICRYMQLKMPKYGEPLVWHDVNNEPVLLLRTWHVRNQQKFDAEPVSLRGADLIARPDVIDLIHRRCAGSLQEIRLVKRDPIS